MDKGYIVVTGDYHANISTKNPPDGTLSVADREGNINTSCDRVIIKNYYGQLCSFGLFGFEWRWRGIKI